MRQQLILLAWFATSLPFGVLIGRCLKLSWQLNGTTTSRSLIVPTETPKRLACAADPAQGLSSSSW